MCVIFTCGETSFRKEVEGYEGLTCRCHNCGNYSASVIKTNPWFTFCFVPVVPLSLKGYTDVSCRICNFAQPLDHRQDVVQMRGGGAGGGGGGYPLEQQQHVPHPQGWGGQPGQKPSNNEPMRYG